MVINEWMTTRKMKTYLLMINYRLFENCDSFLTLSTFPKMKRGKSCQVVLIDWIFRTIFPAGQWRHLCATAPLGVVVWVPMFTCIVLFTSVWREHGSRHHLWPLCAHRHLHVVTSEFRPPFRRWFGFWGLGMLRTPDVPHPELGRARRRRTPLHWFLLYQPSLQSLQVCIKLPLEHSKKPIILALIKFN